MNFSNINARIAKLVFNELSDADTNIKDEEACAEPEKLSSGKVGCQIADEFIDKQRYAISSCLACKCFSF